VFNYKGSDEDKDHPKTESKSVRKPVATRAVSKKEPKSEPKKPSTKRKIVKRGRKRKVKEVGEIDINSAYKESFEMEEAPNFNCPKGMRFLKLKDSAAVSSANDG
jgi:hypothetical protein